MARSWRFRIGLSLVLISAAMVFLDGPVHIALQSLDRSLLALHGSVTHLGHPNWMLSGSALTALSLWAASGMVQSRQMVSGLQDSARACVLVFLSVGLSGIAAAVLKHAIGRARARLYDDVGAFAFSPFSFERDYLSFPSAHSTALFAFAMAFGLLFPRWRGAVLSLAAFLALSRLSLSAHYFSDVLAGALLGSLVTSAIFAEAQRRRLHTLPQSWQRCRMLASARRILAVWHPRHPVW